MKSLTAMLAFALAACSQSPEPVPPFASVVSASPDSVMLRITNTTNGPLLIKGLPSLSPPIPQPLGGILVLGLVGPGTSCIALPDSIVIAGSGPGQTDTIRWTTAGSIAITALDTIDLVQVGYTGTFVPNSAAGWDITFPGTGIAAAPAEACTR